jgi:hypothetical protein
MSFCAVFLAVFSPRIIQLKLRQKTRLKSFILTFLVAVAAEYQKFRFYSTLPSNLVAYDHLNKITLLTKISFLFVYPKLTVLLIVFRVVGPSEASTETEISELDVSFLINQNIVRLNISV